MPMRLWPALLFLLLAGPLPADEVLRICHGYGCLVEEEIVFSEARLLPLGQQLLAAVDAESERKILSGVIGQLYAWAGEVSSIRNDRGGNYADPPGSGKMDCIDHSTSTSRLLALLAARKSLRWHRVGKVETRYLAWLLPVHYSAAIIENGDGEEARFVVDSWFVDNGQPAVILPLEEWKKGAGPDV